MLTSKVEKVLKRMRWKVLEFLGKLDNDSQKETYGFKSLKCSIPEDCKCMKLEVVYKRVFPSHV